MSTVVAEEELVPSTQAAPCLEIRVRAPTSTWPWRTAVTEVSYDTLSARLALTGPGRRLNFGPFSLQLKTLQCWQSRQARRHKFHWHCKLLLRLRVAITEHCSGSDWAGCSSYLSRPSRSHSCCFCVFCCFDHIETLTLGLFRSVKLPLIGLRCTRR